MDRIIRTRRYLPHLFPAHGSIFITTRLAGSLPADVVHALQTERTRESQRIDALPESTRDGARRREHSLAFGRLEAALHSAVGADCWLEHPAVAAVVVEEIQALCSETCAIPAYCVMPNHLHLVIHTTADDAMFPIPTLMQRLKGRTAYRANRILDRRGAFWQHESYDHVVRDASEYARIIRYVLDNPVKAGLVQVWDQWPWSGVQSLY